MKIAALLTGRGNSTLRDKNIRKVLRKPLLAYPAEAAAGSKHITSFYVSSDDEKILDIASRYGYIKIKRPKHLSRPSSKHRDVIEHALEVMKNRYVLIPDILVVLLVNTACVTTEWIDRCIEDMLDGRGLSAVVPVCEDLDHHPFRAKKIGEDGFLSPFFDFGREKISTNRQDLEPSYFLCHNFWVLKVRSSVFSKNGQKPWEFMGSKVKPFIIDECCDVHDEKDIQRSEEWVKRNL